MPIVNENDTVAVQELRIGDNDTLSAQVSAGSSRRGTCVAAWVGIGAGCCFSWPAPASSHSSSHVHVPRVPLPAQVATLVQADWLFLLTDVPNLFTANPNTDPSAEAIYEVPDLSKLHVSGWWVPVGRMPACRCLPALL